MGYILVIYYLDAPISIPFIILNTFINLSILSRPSME